MDKGGLRLVVVLGTLLASTSCSSGGATGESGGSGGGGTAGNEPPATVTCEDQAGQTCSCPSGLLGEIACDGGRHCDCPACPALSIPSPTAFTACGGDPIGDWRLVSHDTSQMKLHFGVFFGFEGVNGTCPAEITQQQMPSLLLKLGPPLGPIQAQSASIHFDARRFHLKAQDACATSQVGKACSTFDGCQASTCGYCECDVEGDVAREDDRGWRVAGTQLVVASDYAFDYCVDGDTLTLQHPLNLEIFVLKRVYLSGIPTPCEKRAADACEGPAQECHLGSCVGTNDCEGPASAEFCTKAGCQWDPNQCGGFDPPECLIGYYDGEPGCRTFDAPPSCIGTSTSCPLTGDCTVPGCTLNEDNDCTGTAPPCESLDYRSCEKVPGCDLQE